jgi:alcohol dehydrogenase class IV
MFTFHAKTRILFGLNSLEQLGAEVRRLGDSKALVITDKGIVEAGLLEKTMAALESAGIEFEIFDEIEPNPKDSTILKGAEHAKDTGADLFIGLGGGSPMDAAKAVAVMSVNDGPLESYCGVGADPWPFPPQPVMAIPTTAGTGSEVSGAAMINLVSQSRKVDIFGSSIKPAVAILDPMLTAGLPPRLTAWTGIDALSHALEAYVGKYANPITDALAEKAILLVADNLRLAYANGQNLEARSNMLLASCLAVLAAGAGLGVVHSLAQTLGGFYDVPHGLSIGVCFPIGVEYNLFAAPEKYAKVSHMLGTNTQGMSTIAAAKTVVPALKELLTDVGIEQDIRSLGVREADIAQLAVICTLDGCTPTNPRPVDARGFAALFKRSLI